MTESAPSARTAPPAWGWRIASLLATAAGVVVLGYAIAQWGWRWFGPAPSPAIAPATPERWAPAIAAAPLFGRSTALPAPPGSTVVAQSGDARLLGVFAEAGGAGYALFRTPDRGPILVQAGAELASGVTLVEVRPGGVRIRDHGAIRDIELRTTAKVTRVETNAATAPRAGPRSAACTPPAGYKGQVYRLNAELLTGIASQPESWKAVLMPVADGLAVRDGSGFATMLGMKTGDRMTQANGIALTGVDDVMVAFVNPLIASQAVRVAGIRDGKPADWLFVNAGACP